MHTYKERHIKRRFGRHGFRHGHQQGDLLQDAPRSHCSNVVSAIPCGKTYLFPLQYTMGSAASCPIRPEADPTARLAQSKTADRIALLCTRRMSARTWIASLESSTLNHVARASVYVSGGAPQLASPSCSFYFAIGACSLHFAAGTARFGRHTQLHFQSDCKAQSAYWKRLVPCSYGIWNCLTSTRASSAC